MCKFIEAFLKWMENQEDPLDTFPNHLCSMVTKAENVVFTSRDHSTAIQELEDFIS